MVNLGDIFPNFEAETTIGKIKFHDWLEDSWGILFSHPADFTPVCTTELARLVQLKPDFDKRDVKIIALSCDTVENHHDWICDIKAYAKESSETFPFPIISDKSRQLAVDLNMIDPNEMDSNNLPLTARAVFVIGPNKRLRLSILYPAVVGRNFTEILRVVDALQLTDKHQVATPVDWAPTLPVMILPTVKKEEVNDMFPKGITVIVLPSGKEYLRSTPHPE